MRTHTQSQTPSEQLAKPEQIVVATDLTDWEFLLPHAIAQAKTCGAHVTLVHSLMSAGVPAMDVGGFAQVEEFADQTMKKMVEMVKAQGISCKSVIAHSFSPEDTLPEIARRLGAKRVIMATHGRGKMGQIMLGSVAHELLGFLDIPIFAVGPKASVHAEHCRPAKILHPVSFSGRYQETIEFARNIAELYGAELILMHVLDPDLGDEINPKRTMAWAKTALDDAIPDRTTIPLRTHVACGNVVDEILNTASVFRADWIVLGTKPLSTKPVSYAPLFANSRAYKLMAAANVPVLTLPHGVRKDAEEFGKQYIPVAVY